MNKTALLPALRLCLLLILTSSLSAQSTSHPHLFFGQAGVDALRNRANQDPLLNAMWLKFKRDRIDNLAMNLTVVTPFDMGTGRTYGNALADLTIGYIIAGDSRYVAKVKEIALELADAPDWSQQLSIAHISIGFAFCWDLLYDKFSSSERTKIQNAVKSKSTNFVNVNQLSNHNWTPSAAEGLLGLAFQGEVKFNRNLLKRAKDNFKEAAGSVLWAHGADGFCPEGPGYWRKYNQVALFFTALRYNEPANDWFHLGKEYPGSEFLQKSAYPRIYTDVQGQDMSCMTWGDAFQIGNDNKGPYGCMGMLALAASEYKDGYVLDFLKTIVNESRYRFEDEDSAAFILYDPTGVPAKSYRNLPLSSYWPDMEGAVFRSGWDKNDLVFFMRCGSPVGRGSKLKKLPKNGHSHPDANGFLLYYYNDYLAAEDGAKPQFGPNSKQRITYGHNTILVDGRGQRGDLNGAVPATNAVMDYFDAPHVGYLLGDATDAYNSLDQFYRFAIYKKHKYVIIVDEIKDDVSHKYEFMLGTDKHHTVKSSGNDGFTVKSVNGNAKLPIVFVEPQSMSSDISTSRPYTFGAVFVDLLKVWPSQKSQNGVFFALLYPKKNNEADPTYTKLYAGGRSGILVDGDEVTWHNPAAARFTYNSLTTDARLSYHKDNAAAFEYLAAGAKELSFQKAYGFTSSEPMVAAFQDRFGTIRLGKILGTNKQATITLLYPGVTGALVDGQMKSLTGSANGSVTFKLSPKQYKTGPTGFEQTVTDNYDVEILTNGGAPAPDISVSPANYNYGSVVVNTSAAKNFTVSNVGAANLNVSATTIAGANANEFSITSGGGAFTLAPGQTRTLAVTFTPASLGGKSAILRISSDDPDENPLDAPLSGSGVSAPPGGGVTFEETATGGANAGSVTSTNLAGGSGRLFLAAVTSKPFRPSKAVSGLGLTWTLVREQCSGRSRTGVALWRATGSTSGGAVTASFSRSPKAAAIVVSSYSGVDPLAPLGNIVSGNTVGVNGGCSGGSDSNAYSFNLATGNSGSVVFGAAAIRGDRHTPGSGYTEREEFAFGGGSSIAGMAIEDRAVPAPATVAVDGSLSNTNDWAVIGVEIRPGTSTPAPDISVNPANYNYGAVIVNSSAAKNFTVSNVGAANLIVNATTIVGTNASEFAITSGGGAFTLAPAQTQTLAVTFAPASVGGKSATLQINSNDPDENPFSVGLTGVGQDSVPSGNVVYQETQTGTSSSASVTSAALSGGAGQLYLAAISARPFQRVNGVNGLGLVWNEVQRQCSTQGKTGISVWRAFGASNPGVVTANLAGAPSNAVIAVSRYSGADPANPVAAFVSGNSNGLAGSCSGGNPTGSYSLGIATGPGNAVVYGAVALRNRIHTPGSGYAERVELRAGSGGATAGLAAQDQMFAAAGNQLLNGTFDSSVDWAAVALVIQPASGAGAESFQALSGKSFSEEVVAAAGLEKSNPPGRSASAELPRSLSLQPPYPNPANAGVSFEYALPEAARVRLIIYNIRGEEVARLADGMQAAGRKTVTWDGRRRNGEVVSSGVYLLRLTVGRAVLTRKLVLQK